MILNQKNCLRSEWWYTEEKEQNKKMPTTMYETKQTKQKNPEENYPYAKPKRWSRH